MFIYNVTTKVDEGVAAAWLQWLVAEHIPEIMATGYFTHYQLVQLLDTDDSEGLTYAAQYYAASKASYNQYLQIHAPLLRQKSMDKWGNASISFRSLMQVISNANGAQAATPSH